jgi:tetratricopeptide (TPR) repeat protein
MMKKLSPAQWVPRLERALVNRNIKEGFSLLDASLKGLPRLDVEATAAVSYLLCLAQWSDLGYRDLRFFDEFSDGIFAIDPRRLQVVDFFRLQMIKAYRALAREQLEESIGQLDLVLRAGEPVLSDYLTFQAHFWKGRAQRKRGDYEQAHIHILEAQKVAARMKAPKLVAVTQIHESWVAFQRGDRPHALKLLDSAEKALKPTGHALSLGNIESARGRFVRRSGEYTRALGHFESAISIYRKAFPQHPNLARAMVNAAYVKRLIALDFRARRGGEQAVGAVHAISLKITREALALLKQAGDIYALHGHHSGAGSALVNAAHLHLDNGDIDQAEIEAERAWALGEEVHDLILTARAQIVQSTVSLARAEEQLGEEQDIALHANLSVEHAESAIQLALKTQNKRLLAEAYIARGMAAADEYFRDWETAKDYAAKATALLGSDDRDHLLKTLAILKSKLIGATKVEETLRFWSDGQLGDRTFQQIQEEFAELVIPKVWLRNGKSVTQVSKMLRISPKKVRRILRNVREQEDIGWLRADN